ncbi:MAG: Peptidoglycan-N-acetylglucosamine deacetylase [Chroococcidiopsis cubana SAG 39.79]|jgi:peptidoglycan/xylan/chitin deacetylase (PgdA/CDA1 family)|uniref:Polysaccharide deacetylase n=2 Tax=Chroococcidiopsis TaxID=54298 RepID=K9TXB6_CHRTP|nr:MULTISPECIES: polysaccharide deacetylase family protein [Chroococcidiopsis]PSB41412.1 polysaccharide deacetylase family protein [Cyanosarcina cf. burmensis CCALA 770]AFY87472.1 polysaccharide deacetylase [Chroococcidiopsis thermalis PCC 7203]MDZ4875042.1 Peptidoglycan-N-acetylglucosamine deacetylase [Chroococcidiopsis cubana SAG 39.79]PSB61559.1 polysaccharide deacetylase family protein [Chroococcidiopsis cubana CCALA 043]RUT09417.1 chitooligosaccharide deacetylase NodB-like protein [Chrooc
MQLAPFLPLMYRILKPSFPSCLWSGHDRARSIALTFDDGPHPSHTPKLLEVLDRYAIPASFFWLGACVRRSPELAKAIYQRGHWIGNHGYDHRSFPMLTPTELQHSLVATQEAIATACDLPTARVRDVRPPNGLFTPQTLNLLHQWDYRPVMWSVVPEDWVCPGVAVVVQRVMQQVQNGSLIVLHDGACGGTDVADVAALLIPQLLSLGYEFVTIDTLWQQSLSLTNQGFFSSLTSGDRSF